MSDTQLINGKSELGDFCWFEPPHVKSPNIFGAIFNRARDSTLFQLDINAENGNVVGVSPTR